MTRENKTNNKNEWEGDHTHTKLTQSIPFLKWMPTNGPRERVEIKSWAFLAIFSLQTRYLWRPRLSNWTGKLAGAPVKASTGR